LPDGAGIFELVANTAPVLIWVSGTDKLCTYFNKPWLDFTGRPLEMELGNGWAEGVHPDDFKRCLSIYCEAFDRRESFRMEYRLRRFDGEYRWVLDTGAPRFNADGSFAGYTGSAVDVTDRKEIEKELGLVNDRLRDAMLSGKSVGWEWDVRSGDDSWFGDLKSMFGISASTFECRLGDFYRYLHPDDKERVSRAVREAMQEHRQYTAEFRTVRPDGTVHWVAAEGRFQYAADGTPERMSGMAVDITDRKLAEEALRASEHRFRQFFATLPEYCWMVSPNGLILDANPAACKALGYTRNELLGMPLSNLFPPESLPKLHDRLAKWKETGEIRNEEVVICTKQGEKRNMLLNVGAVRDAQGQILYSTSVLSDITERKQMEEALSSMHRKLIEAQERERTRIARDLHDDINQSLALLALELEQLRRTPPGSASGFREHLGDLGKRVSSIVSDVHAISHELHSSKLELLGLVAAAKSFCSEFAKQKRVEIDFSHEGIPKPLPNDISICLFRVLQEALQNAVKHSQVRCFRVQLQAAEGEVHLMVRDAGIGFEPAANSHAQGLGLISMQERAALVGGTICVASKPHAGTVIRCSVPIPPESPAVAILPAAAKSRKRAVTITQ